MGESASTVIDLPAELINQHIKIPVLHLADNEKKGKIDSFLKPFVLNGEILFKIGNIFEEEMTLGIADKPSSLQMENTYVPELPDGLESGEFMALDMGGMDFRVLYIKLANGNYIKEYVESYHIEDELRQGNGDTLFDFIAECISSFVRKHNLTEKDLPLGFTFSFPMHQHALDSGILITWTKSFSAFGVEGEDVAQLLREALHRRGDTRVELVAIMNDSTGTLLQGALSDKNAAVGLIVGNGTNACYIEKADNVTHWETERHGEKEVIIDIELGAFGDNGTVEFLKTEYDKILDANSYFSNSFTFEKYISALYLGELVRLVLNRLVRERLLFTEDGNINVLSDKGSFTTQHVALIEQDNADGLVVNTESVLSEIGVKKYSEDDVKIVQRVCHVVSLRAALLVSICLSRVLKRIDREQITVVADGVLYRLHPRLHRWIVKYTSLFSPEKKFKLIPVTDGSGKGAALVACLAVKLASRFPDTPNGYICHNG